MSVVLYSSLLRDGMWCNVMWCDVMWCVVWCGVMWWCVIWCDVTWCDVMWHGVMWCTEMWCTVMSNTVLCGVLQALRAASYRAHVGLSAILQPIFRKSAATLRVNSMVRTCIHTWLSILFIVSFFWNVICRLIFLFFYDIFMPWSIWLTRMPIPLSLTRPLSVS